MTAALQSPTVETAVDTSATEVTGTDSQTMPPGDYGGRTAPWVGTLAVEGQVTGDGREFAPDSLTWADLPLPLRWNKEDSHGGQQTTTAVNVGRIDRIWRQGNELKGSGVFNLDEVDGARAYELVKGQFLRGVSIDADSIGDADVELVWDDDAGAELSDVTADEEEDGPDIIKMLFGRPKKTIYHAGRIRAATLVDIPAFDQAFVAIDDDARQALAASGAAGAAATVTLVAVAPHDTATSGGSWDAGANERRLPSPMPVTQARAAYAWVDPARAEDGRLPKTAGKFIHHEVGPDGAVGPANLTACSSGIGVLHGGRGGANIPASDARGVYNHLAAHLRAGGMEPPPFAADALVAHAFGHDEVWRPPVEWFRDPGLNVLVPLTITDEGRIYGHAAQWGQCHIGFGNACVTPPREPSHPYFLKGEVVCADGSVLPVGQITMNTSHAKLYAGASAASEHYDNTGLAVADVAVGNDQHGIWLAGAIRPDVPVARVNALRAAGQVSGDWRRIGGKLRLVALLAVNVPGYPIPRLRARVASGDMIAVVAAGQPGINRLTEDEQSQHALELLRQSLVRRVLGPSAVEEVS